MDRQMLETRVQDAIDAGANPLEVAGLKEHLAADPDLRAEAEQLWRLDQWLKASPGRADPAECRDVVDAVLGAVDLTPQQKPDPRRSAGGGAGWIARMGLPAAAAATLSVGAAAGWGMGSAHAVRAMHTGPADVPATTPAPIAAPTGSPCCPVTGSLRGRRDGFAADNRPGNSGTGSPNPERDANFVLQLPGGFGDADRDGGFGSGSGFLFDPLPVYHVDRGDDRPVPASPRRSGHRSLSPLRIPDRKLHATLSSPPTTAGSPLSTTPADDCCTADFFTDARPGHLSSTPRPVVRPRTATRTSAWSFSTSTFGDAAPDHRNAPAARDLALTAP